MNDGGRYVDVNPAICQLLGYSHEEFLRLNAGDLTPLEERERLPELRDRFFATGRLSGEYTLVCKDGSTRDFEFRSVANILPGIHLGVYRDISDASRPIGSSGKAKSRSGCCSTPRPKRSTPLTETASARCATRHAFAFWVMRKRTSCSGKTCTCCCTTLEPTAGRFRKKNARAVGRRGKAKEPL